MLKFTFPWGLTMWLTGEEASQVYNSNDTAMTIDVEGRCEITVTDWEAVCPQDDYRTYITVRKCEVKSLQS